MEYVRVRQLRIELTDQIKYSGVSRRCTRGAISQRRLIDLHDLVEMVLPFDHPVRSRCQIRTME